MANLEHLKILKQGVETWNQWRQNVPNLIPDLNNADLSFRNFTSANLSQANLDNANLQHAELAMVNLAGGSLVNATLRHVLANLVTLYRADLHGADLSDGTLGDADMRGANLRGVKFDGADLRGANLSFASLRAASLKKSGLAGSNFDSADLTGADLTEAMMWNTLFANNDLREAKGLDTVSHIGPSTVGIDTIYRSRGKIPEVFLRAAGVPDDFIAYTRSLVVRPFHSCFISHSSHDQAFAERLYADLLAKDLRCWFAPEDLKIGDRFQERIEESIRVFDKVIVVLSAASVESRWVEREVNSAREREERENCTVLFPIRIDDTVMNAPQPWAAYVRNLRYIGDFRRWEVDSSYQKAFERLLRDLKKRNES